LSFHELIILQDSLIVRFVGFQERIYIPRVSWVKATAKNLLDYQDMLSLKLRDIHVPTKCSNVNCSSSTHLQRLNKYATDITNSCIIAAENAIPSTCRRQDSARIAGWAEYVQPVREKSMFWHGIWLQCGRPKTGAVADCMRRTRAAYHCAIRKVKHDEDSIINERLADSVLRNYTRDFLQEVKRIRSYRAGTSHNVDGQTESSNIAKAFTDKFRDLYTSVPYDVNEMRRIQDDVEHLLAKEPSHYDAIFILLIFNMLFRASKHTKTMDVQASQATILSMQGKIA
jgi:hypothetical protein